MLPLTLAELHSRLMARSLTPSSVLDQAVTRLRSLAELNMFVTECEDTAREQAREADRRYREDRVRGPLDGAILAVKDNFCTKGIRTTCGSLMLDNFTAPYSATVVQRSLGKSNSKTGFSSDQIYPRWRLCNAGQD